MSERTFTPGPWRVDETRALGAYGVWADYVDPKHARFPETQEQSLVCSVYDNQQSDFPRDMRDANARLIAAAPTLLEACQWALGTIRGNTYGLTPEEREQALELAAKGCEEAITQATGAER